MKNQSGTIKTNLELDRLVMGGSGGYRRLPGGSDDFSLQTNTQTLHHNIYIITIIVTFIRVSDELGHLVAGKHKAGRGREALLDLLGPAFVGRHLRMHWKEDLQTTCDHGRQKEALDQGGQHLTSQRQSGRISGRVKSSRSGRLTKSRSRW